MPPTKPTILLATDTPTFDIEPWALEGYSIHLLTHATINDIEDATDDLESNDKYGIIGPPLSHPQIPPLTPNHSIRYCRHRRPPIRCPALAATPMRSRILPSHHPTHQLPTGRPDPAPPARRLSIQHTHLHLPPYPPLPLPRGLRRSRRPSNLQPHLGQPRVFAHTRAATRLYRLSVGAGERSRGTVGFPSPQ